MNRLLLGLATAALLVTSCKDKPADAPAATAPKAEAAKPEAAKPEAAKGEATFSLAQPKVGTKHVDTSVTHMDMAMSVGKEKHTMSNDEHSTFTVEYLEVDGEVVKKAKITYGARGSTDVDDGKKKEEPAMVANKSYLVAMKGEQVEVTTLEGKPVDDDEAKMVTDDADFVGRPDALRAAFPHRALKVGEAVPELTKVIQELVSDDADSDEEGAAPEVSNVNVVFKEDRGDVGVFSTTMTMTTDDEGSKSTVELSGVLEVRKADTQLLVVDLQGPLKLKMGDIEPGMKVSASGTMQLKITRVFQ